MRKLLLPALLLVLFACNTKQEKKKPESENNLSQPASMQETVIDSSLKFDTYCNARFGYCIDYPGSILFPQPESENGDGRIFKDKQGNDALIVFGRLNLNIDGEVITIDRQFEDDLKDIRKESESKITYQKINKAFFVISGYKNGKIFYQKTILKDDSFAYAILQYNEKEKDIFNKISERVFKSFK